MCGQGDTLTRIHWHRFAGWLLVAAFLLLFWGLILYFAFYNVLTR